MARMPEADWQGEHSPRRAMVRHDIVCVHTIVGYAPAHAAHFSVKADGRILQSRDTAFQSAANLFGNPRVIAIENEDHGTAFPKWTGSNVPPLTDAQVAANARILAWAHKQHGVPLRLCPDSRPGSKGLAYHRQGCDGNFGPYRHPGRQAGGEVWTTSYGKVCPGDNRIDQLPTILNLASGDDDMTPEQETALVEKITRSVAKAIMGRDLYGDPDRNDSPADAFRKIISKVPDIEKKLDEVLARLPILDNPAPVDPAKATRPKG